MNKDRAPLAAASEKLPLGAWAVHAFTASGIVLALLALEAVIDGRDREALLWLLAALAVDGIDGTFARAARVKERLPRIDGDALDLIIDYTTYVLIPALMFWRMEVLPEDLALPLVALVLVSSLYVFARRDMKTDDGYFRGFPALWNIVAFYFVVTPPQPGLAAAIVAGLIVLTFAPVHAVHPFRVRDYGIALPILAFVWAAATAGLLWPGLDDPVATSLLGVSVATAVVLLGMGLLRTIRGPRGQEEAVRRG
jgi:phosphatidylcholine synthase